MLEIRKVTADESPRACLPHFTSDRIVGTTLERVVHCAPTIAELCNPSRIVRCSPDFTCTPLLISRRFVSGTYRSNVPYEIGGILELRVDVDGRRPQNCISGDFFLSYSLYGSSFTLYLFSFAAETLTVSEVSNEMAIIGPISHYSDSTSIGDTIEVRIPRVSTYVSAADATVKFYSSGSLQSTYICPKTSECFRTVTLEIDRFQGTTFPPTVNTHVDPHPADLTDEDLSCSEVYRRAGIDMTVVEDDVLNDSDSDDPGSNWNEGELHDLMEDRFDLFADKLQWNVYGVIVPRFGDPDYNPGYYGVMFDFGGWQTGDTYLRQGAAIALDALQGRVSGTLYNTAAKSDRFFLETFIHEIGHAFNLPHTWSRANNPDSSSESFMNYPWEYTGGAGNESAFWSNFRWEFDDVELEWMRHADRKDVIFGGNDWVWNNLSIYTEPEIERINAPLSLEVRSFDLHDFGAPVKVELKLKNLSSNVLKVNAHLIPENGLVTIYIRRPNGERVRYVPPVRRDMADNCVDLAPGESVYETVMLSYGANGPLFHEPGEYNIRAYYNLPGAGVVISKNFRLRVTTPTSRGTEELAHLLFSHEVAKFIYFGGVERYPKITSRLEEVVEKYAKTEPVLVRHINAVLGLQASRGFKRVVIKNGCRVVNLRKANPAKAVKHLEAAREPVPVRRVSALDLITYNRLSTKLADCYLSLNKKAEAERTLRRTLSYFQRQHVVKSVLTDYKERIKSLSSK